MGELRFYKKRRRLNYDLIRTIFTWLFTIFVIVMIAYVLVHFLGGRISTIGDSMDPVLENGDHVLVNKFSYLLGSPERFDIVVFKPNGNENSYSYIRRVVGLPGETVKIESGKIYIDGEILDEEYEHTDIGDPGIAEDGYQLDNTEYFVLGDNRSGIDDSRQADIGPVKKDYMEGKAWFIISPQEKMGVIKD